MFLQFRLEKDTVDKPPFKTNNVVIHNYRICSGSGSVTKKKRQIQHNFVEKKKRLIVFI